MCSSKCFFFYDTATTEIYTYLHTLSLHDALPICIAPITAAVFQAGDDTGIGFKQTLDERMADAYLADGWDVVQIQPQAAVAYSFDNLRKMPEQAFVADAFIVKGWQHEYARASRCDGVAGHFNAFRHRACSGSRHHAARWKAFLQQSVE